MTARLNKEFKLVEVKFGAIEVDPDLRWCIVKVRPVGAGWNKASTAVLIQIPPGYPTTPPDNFWADADLRLSGGAMPGNASTANVAGREWVQFSYHVEGWAPVADIVSGHNLLTFLAGCDKRLTEAS